MSSISNVTAGKRNLKIVLLGDSGVGKTALIERFVHNRYQTKESVWQIFIQLTIGIDFVGKNIHFQGQSYRLQLWDTAGQERYRSLIPSYLKDAMGAIFVFDITSNQHVSQITSPSKALNLGYNFSGRMERKGLFLYYAGTNQTWPSRSKGFSIQVLR